MSDLYVCFSLGKHECWILQCMRALKFIAFEAKLFIIDATKIAVKANSKCLGGEKRWTRSRKRCWILWEFSDHFLVNDMMEFSKWLAPKQWFDVRKTPPLAWIPWSLTFLFWTKRSTTTTVSENSCRLRHDFASVGRRDLENASTWSCRRCSSSWVSGLRVMGVWAKVQWCKLLEIARVLAWICSFLAYQEPFRFKHFQTIAPWTLGAVMPYEEAVDMLKKSIKKMYGKKARQHCA